MERQFIDKKFLKFTFGTLAIKLYEGYNLMPQKIIKDTNHRALIYS